MSAALCEEPPVLEIVAAESGATEPDAAGRELARVDVMAANWEAATVTAEGLAAFLELLAGADAEYLDLEDCAGSETPFPLIDWDTVSDALGESREILVRVQELLAEMLNDMGVEDARFIRVGADASGRLRLVSDHPRRAEIEMALNAPENESFRELHAAALVGLGLAGGLVGNCSLPTAMVALATEAGSPDLQPR